VWKQLSTFGALSIFSANLSKQISHDTISAMTSFWVRAKLEGAAMFLSIKEIEKVYVEIIYLETRRRCLCKLPAILE